MAEAVDLDTAAASGREALAATFFIDRDAGPVVAFAVSAAGEGSQREQAVRLYRAVRDGFFYDPYSIELTPDFFRASACLASGRGFCITKAVLLAAAARAIGIPAKLGFADVRNHLSTPRLLALMGTDIFHWHGYASLFLEGRWVKATPAFNIQLCNRFGIRPLEFDGLTDSILHPFDAAGRQHMEYVHDRGLFDDLPYEAIAELFALTYPNIVGKTAAGGDFAKEAAAEGARGQSR
jgi:transglutaminase-like putative cysteine protease